MSSDRFEALVLTQEEGHTRHSFESLGVDDLPEGDVLVSVSHSSLNYKDGLAVTGKGKVVRRFPMVPGIDLAGVVESSESPDFAPGQQVLATGWGLGEQHWGGYSQKARVKSSRLVPMPDGLDPARSMALGTAGFTAMLCVMALEEHGLEPGDGPVVVTGAAGGVGSIAVAVLAKLGYEVTASTGRSELGDYLKGLGAAELLEREELAGECRPLESERWAGAVDTVGGQTLASLLAHMRFHCGVAACGLAGGMDLPTTVAPFILRGVSLLGIDSNMCPQSRRLRAWNRLARDLPAKTLDGISSSVGLREIPALCEKILQGQVRGRIVVDLNA